MPKSKIITVDTMRHGFIYPVVRSLIELLACLNLVELFKSIGKRLASDASQLPRNARIGIDVYVILKWTFLISVWAASVNMTPVTFVVAYLLFTNIFTYFYYHVWKPPYDSSDENLRSRLVTLILSIAYSIACFGYLYAVPYVSAFRVDPGIDRTVASLLFSVSRSFLVDFAPMAAVSTAGYIFVVIQTTITFIFISIILSASIPQYRKMIEK